MGFKQLVLLLLLLASLDCFLSLYELDLPSSLVFHIYSLILVQRETLSVLNHLHLNSWDEVAGALLDPYLTCSMFLPIIMFEISSGF
jgi:hypothetical protein